MFHSPLKRGAGCPKLYHQNGATPTQPPGGWHSESVDTPHGTEAIALIRSGAISQTDHSHQIWTRYAQLQVVSPTTFPRFIRKCLKRAGTFEAPADIPDSPDPLDDLSSSLSVFDMRSSFRSPTRSGQSTRPTNSLRSISSDPEGVDGMVCDRLVDPHYWVCLSIF